MITRAYQNSKGERQEVALSAEEWENLTEADLQSMLGFVEEAKEEPVAKAVPALKKAFAKKK